LFTLVDEGIIPIINENDTVSVEEIKIGDNDTLAARSAVLWSADLLILFSDIDGLYSANPALAKTPPDFIPIVDDIAAIRTAISTEGASPLGTGGIVTKLDAAAIAADYGISTIITRGKTAEPPQRASLEALQNGTQRGTIFCRS
jgi:glutamate 5-kinase